MRKLLVVMLAGLVTCGSAYAADAEQFRTCVGPLATATLGHVQAFSDSLHGLAPSSQAMTLASAAFAA